jgi:hypothetical protein
VEKCQEQFEQTAIQLDQTVAIQKKRAVRIRHFSASGGGYPAAEAAKFAALNKLSILASFCRLCG